MTLVYSDSPLGMIDITEQNATKPMGNIAIAGVSASENYTAPSGPLKAFEITTGADADAISA